jgi:hypothetical protein
MTDKIRLSIEQVRASIEAVHAAGIDGRPIPTAGKQVVASYADLAARLEEAKAEASLQRTIARNYEARLTETEEQLTRYVDADYPKRLAEAEARLEAAERALQQTREVLEKIAYSRPPLSETEGEWRLLTQHIARAALAADEEDVPGAFGPGRIWNPAVFRDERTVGKTTATDGSADG